MATPLDPSLVLEPYRRYLTVLATVHLDPALRTKVDPADIVQQVMLRACVSLPELRAIEPAGIAAWLRRILANELLDALKYYYRDKRDIALEQSMEAALDQSASGLVAWLAAEQTSPSAKAIQNEQMLRMADALAELPPLMREVVVLKHCQSWTLEQIASRLGKSIPSIASLLRRGLEQLRRHLDAGDSSHE